MFGKTKNAVALLILLLLVPSFGGIQAAEDQVNVLTLEQRSTAIQLQTIQPLLDREALWASLDDEDPFGPPADEPEMYGTRRKSVRKAFFYSLLVPGAGQIYNGSTIIKPILFLGLEVAGIAGYLNYQSNGDDLRTEYEGYADEHWYYDKYIQWFDAAHDIQDGYDVYKDGDRAPYWNQEQYTNEFSEHINLIYPTSPDTGVPVKDHAYYENVGKYDQFQYGWEDTYYTDNILERDSLSAYREVYLDMRKSANDEFNKASTILTLTIVNHLMSAFDAALMARRYNNQQEQLSQVSVKMRYVMYEGRPMPKVMLSYRY